MTNKTSNVNYDEIFPPLKWEELPAALQDHRLREEVLEELKRIAKRILIRFSKKSSIQHPWTGLRL